MGLVGFLAAEPVDRAVGQYLLEQKRQFVGGFVAVVFDQPHHAVLNDVQGGLFVADMVEAALESPRFNAFEEVRYFCGCCQT